MTFKDYLRQARRLKSSIEGKRERVKLMYELCDLKSLATGEKVQGGEKTGAYHVIDAIVQMTAEADAQIWEYIKVYTDIAQRAEKLPNENQRKVFELYYFSEYDWFEISEKLSYTIHHVKRLYKNALAEMEKNYEIEING